MYIRQRDNLITILKQIEQGFKQKKLGEENLQKYMEYIALVVESLECFAPEYDMGNLISIFGKLEIFYTNQTRQKKEIVDFLKMLEEEISALRQFPCKYKMLFLPYKASMWTAMESVWQEAIKDPMCEATVMVSPYFLLDSKGNKISVEYEADKFPKYVPITHYQQYNLKQEMPEMIMIHNPYDDDNTLTRMPDLFFSSSLKQYTKKLVYSPYGNFAAFDDQQGIMMCCTKGVENSDLILTASPRVKEIYKLHGVPEKKLLSIGSPKMDAIVNYQPKEEDYPEEWKEKLGDKKVILLNTHLSYFQQGYFYAYHDGAKDRIDYAKQRCLQIMCNILRVHADEVALIWRPHPLMMDMLRTKMPQCVPFVEKMWKRIENAPNAVIDTTGDYRLAFSRSDAMISSYSSLVSEYMITGKPILMLGKGFRKEVIEQSPVNLNLNYFRAGKTAISFGTFINMIVNGQDPKKEARLEMLSRAFENLDGTIGKKTYDELVKQIME